METTVSLVQMLDARERRVQHQQELLARYHKPLICFTMNICGPVKDSPLIRRGFGRGRQLLRQQFLRAKLTPLYQDAVREVTGCEAFYVLDADPLTIPPQSIGDIRVTGLYLRGRRVPAQAGGVAQVILKALSGGKSRK